MPLSRYEIRNEYSLGDRELYRAADKDDPQALLEGVAMAALVGVLRQLGDLAQFAAEIFHDLHEEAMATAARGHDLVVRVQQLEAELPPIEKAFLSQTNHSVFFGDAGIDWHPTLNTDQNLITQGDLPRFIMDSYEECRGPPRLFLLDKFDVAGAGSCLKRYTDPSFFKVEASSNRMTSAEVQRERKARKAKRKGSPWRNGETPEVLPSSHAKLHQLFLEERVQNGISDPARLVKLKRRLNGFPLGSKPEESYMQKFLKSLSPEDKGVHKISNGSPLLKLPYNITSESGLEIVEICSVSSGKKSVQINRKSCSSPSGERTLLKPSMDELHDTLSDGGILDGPKYPKFEVLEGKEMAVNGESKTIISGDGDGYQSDDILSEVDSYVDALATMESEIETEAEFRARNDLGVFNIEKQGTDFDTSEERIQAQYFDSQSLRYTTASDDECSSYNKGTSSFSCSDTASALPLKNYGSAVVFPFNEVCEAGITGMSSNQVSLNEGGLVNQPPEHAISNGSCHPDSALVQLPVDPEAISAGGSFGGPELDDKSSNHNEFVSGFVSTEANEVDLDHNIPCAATLTDVPSQTEDDSPPTMSSENHPVDKSGDEDPEDLSCASTHLESILEAVTPTKKSRESLFGDVLRTENEKDSRTKNFGDGKFSSPDSVISHAKEALFAPVLSEFKTCNSDVQPESVVSVDDTIPSAEEIEVKSTPAADDSPDTPEQHISEITEDVHSLVLDSAEVGISYFGGKKLDGALGTEDGEEMRQIIIPNMNLVGRDAATIEFSSDIVNYPGPALLTEVCIHINEKETEIFQSETVVDVSAVSIPHTDGNEDDANPLTANFRKLEDECLCEACLQQNHEDSRTDEEVVNHHIVSPLDLDYHAPSEQEWPIAEAENIVHLTAGGGGGDGARSSSVQDSDSKSPQTSNFVENTYDAEAKNILHLTDDDSTFPSSSSKHSSQDSESKSPQHKDCLIENSEDALSSLPTLCFAVLRVVPLKQKVQVKADIELLHADEEKSLGSFSHHMDRERSIEASYSDSYIYPEHLPCQLGQKGEQVVAESLQNPGEASFDYSSSDLDQHMQSLNHMDHKICFDDAYEASMSELLPQSGSGIAEQATTDPLSLVFPVGLFPEVTLEEMPPLPPLPPVQWRLGKLQNTSLVSGRDYNVNHPSKADEKTQMGYPALVGGIVQPSNPFSSLTAAKDENSQQVNESLVCNWEHSGPVSMQIPSSLNQNDSQYDYVTLGRNQPIDPFANLTTTYIERPQHGFHHGGAGAGQGIMQPNLKPLSSVATAGDTASGSLHEVIEPQHQLQPEASLKNKKLEHTSILDVEVINPPDSIKDEQPQHVSPTAEGETARSSSAYCFPDIEGGGNPNVKCPMKLPRPQSPLIDDVAAHDKSKLRKVTERVQPQIQKDDERYSLLEQIRTKSFNLKPAFATRPSIQGPKTNLKVAAILKKANVICQALAGRDEDDGTDSWSDS